MIRRLAIFGSCMVLSACSSQQSALHPTGVDAERINVLFWIMSLGGLGIFALVLVLAGLALFGSAPLRQKLAGEGVIKWLGIALPVAVLSVLLVYGFLILRAGEQRAPDQSTMRIAVSGEQWWWRVTYHLPDGQIIESANEIHLPVGQAVALELTTADVIHSFWAPNLAGKLDMIPGRANVLTVTATEPGITRGQCAEYCGGAHAFMSFHVVAQTPEAFVEWIEAEAGPGLDPIDERASNGQALFMANGCGGCHRVGGTKADGRIGPDLTHVGARHSLAAATLPNRAEDFAAFITNNQHIKPENRMPEYAIFSEAELADLALYLEGLR